MVVATIVDIVGQHLFAMMHSAFLRECMLACVVAIKVQVLIRCYVVRGLLLMDTM